MTALEEEVEKEEDRVKIGAKRGNNTKGRAERGGRVAGAKEGERTG